MKYDFVCKSDPVSHINNRKTTTQDKAQNTLALMIHNKKKQNTELIEEDVSQ